MQILILELLAFGSMVICATYLATRPFAPVIKVYQFPVKPRIKYDDPPTQETFSRWQNTIPNKY
jgi:hypothetical protein